MDWEDLSGELDADGTLDVTFEVPLEYFFRLAVVAPGHATTSWRFHGIGRGDDKRMGKQRLEPGFTVRGQIVTPAGELLDDRRWSVTAEGPQGNKLLERTATRVQTVALEGQASFELAGLPAGDVSFHFSSQGQRTREPQALTLPAETTELHTFTVDLNQTVSSSLKLSVDPRIGALAPPLEPGDFHATAADGRVLEVVAGGSGSADFEVLDAAPAPISLSLSHARFEPWAAEIEDTGRTKMVELIGSASLELDVRDSDGNPVDVYSVAFAQALEHGEFSSYEQSVHEGRDALPGGLVDDVIPRSYRLIVRGTMGESVTALDDLQPGERRVLSITLAPGDRMTGTVSYPGGGPAMGVEVYLVRPAEVDDSDASILMLGGGAGYGGDEWRTSVAETRSDWSSEVFRTLELRMIRKVADRGSWGFQRPSSGVHPADGCRIRSIREVVRPTAVAAFVIGTVELMEGQVHEETFSFVNGVPTVVTVELPQGEGLDGDVSVSFYRADGGKLIRRGRIQGTVGDMGTCYLEPGTYVAEVAQGGAAVLNGPVFAVPEAAAHTVPIGVLVMERRIRVFSEGTPLASQSVEIRSPQGPSARFTTDAEGWMTIRLEAGPLKARWRMMQSELMWPPASDELHLSGECT